MIKKVKYVCNNLVCTTLVKEKIATTQLRKL